MVLPWGLLLSSMVLSVLSGLVPDKNAHITILELMNQDQHVCNFPPKEMLQDSSKAGFLNTCRVELNKDPSTENDTLMVMRDNPSYLLCMGVYDLSVHICESGVSPAALFNNSEQFHRKFQDETHAELFCSNVQELDALEPALNQTRPWVKVLNDYLASPELCDTLCMRKPLGVNHLCKVIAWGRKLVADKRETALDDPSAEDTVPLVEENLTQNGAAQMEQEAPTAVAAAVVNKSTSAASLPAAPQSAPGSSSNSSPKSVPASVSSSSSAPVIKSDKSVAPSSTSAASAAVSKAADPEVSLPGFKKPELATKSAANTSSATAPVQTSSASPAIDNQEENYDDREGLAEIDQDSKGKTGEYDDDDSLGFVNGYAETKLKPASTNGGSQPYESGGFSKEDPVENESNFYAYFLTMVIVVIVGYVLFHNKQKILALLVEGRRGNQSSRRRPNSSNYRKLDTNLEEAITSPAPRSTNSHVIY